MTDDENWNVVIDAQGRHSVWPADREPPRGWTATGYSGRREDCVAHIDRTWTDPLPASWRETLRNREEAASNA
ncbi:MbtH family NRPS accessory protein [Methylopila sp. M107]|uniref:MbtH family NRPS accessory protein n=1 Tax=Methylopila sp. M107 TaxID=1101190 RepID=UPI000362D190|nr:MbtH family NRPS accessory protein [Methylopila sp. M107]